MAECADRGADVRSGSESSDESAGDNREMEELQYEILTVLAKGNAFKYVIPSFPVYDAKIIEVKLQWEEKCEDGSSKLHVFDGFAQLCEDLDHPLPGVMCIIKQRYDCAFMIEVSRVNIQFTQNLCFTHTHRHMNSVDQWTSLHINFMKAIKSL